MNYYQIGPNTIRVQSILDLMMEILEDPIYEYLCTQEKLRYEVYARVRLYYGIVGYSITASSHQTKKGAKNLERGIDQFHHAMLQILNKMRDDEFLRSKEKLIQAKLAPDDSLAMESDRHWEEIINGDFLFDRNQQQADALHNITKEEMISFVVDTNAAHCRKLSIQVIGNPPTEWAYDWASERTNYSSDVFLETHQTPSSVSVSEDQLADGSENGDWKSTTFSWEESLYEDLGSRLNLVLLPTQGENRRVRQDGNYHPWHTDDQQGHPLRAAPSVQPGPCLDHCGSCRTEQRTSHCLGHCALCQGHAQRGTGCRRPAGQKFRQEFTFPGSAGMRHSRERLQLRADTATGLQCRADHQLRESVPAASTELHQCGEWGHCGASDATAGCAQVHGSGATAAAGT
ncbi:nardilysin-like isoform X1 [Drosophila miranda]|nr:nardilysin-like isoform X1 [Drosophila miranda]